MRVSAGEENPRPARAEQRTVVAGADMLVYSRSVQSVDDDSEDRSRFLRLLCIPGCAPLQRIAEYLALHPFHRGP